MTTRFSIIVPTLNRKAMLLNALDSIRVQGWGDVEIIVADGGSTDGTIEAVEARADIVLLKGPDRGVYDAFNKGIARATGEIVGILNSDDRYEPGTFAAVADVFTQHPEIDAVCGTALLVASDRIIAVYDRDADKRLTPRTALIGNCTPNARFFRRSALTRNGPFNVEYRYVADRDWLMRWHANGLRTFALPQRVYRYGQHPGSLTFDADRKRETDIRLELLRLARYWLAAPAADVETVRIATALEGRCLAYLAINALRSGHVGDAARWLARDNEAVSTAPMLAVLRSTVDWAIQHIKA